MARLFDDAVPDFLQVNSAVVTAAPFTIVGWARTNDVNTADQGTFFLGDKDVIDQHWRLEFDTSIALNPIEMTIDDGATKIKIDTTAGVSVNVWHHHAIVEAAANDHRVYLDGGFKNTSSSNSSPTGADRMAIGQIRDSSPSSAFSGDIAHMAIWDVALSDSEIATLSFGVSPLRVHRDSLVAYWPVGGQSPERDIIVGGFDMVVNGTPTQSEEPPIPYSIVAPGL